jgi:hypothetical protein
MIVNSPELKKVILMAMPKTLWLTTMIYGDIVIYLVTTGKIGEA